MTPEQRKKSIAAALSIGAVGIAAALTSLNNGTPVDCSLRASCQRLDEQAGAWVRCPTSVCAQDVERGYDETAAQCPNFKPTDCTPEMLK